MANDFAVKVVTPDGEVWSGRATSVVIPGLDGYFGVWKDHVPTIAGMDTGALWIKTPEEHVITLLAVDGGFVEVGRDGVTVLAESAQLGSEIDVIAATKEEEAARAGLAQHFSDIEVARSEVALKKALNRKRVADLAKSKPTQMVQ
jgi:F-type H+-transporting ATPase subunit epsilon